MRPIIGLATAIVGWAAAGAAGAVVGPSGDGAAFAPGVVMVLNHQGRTAGFCSAAVVAPDTVLTAAHCVPAGAALKIHYRDGTGRPVLLDVAAVERHPGYRADAIRSRQRSVDLALVRLQDALPTSFSPVRLGAITAAPAGTPVRLVGYGVTQEGEGASSGTLRLAPLVARAPVSDLLLWARDPAGRGAGACTGDSGAPVFAADEDRLIAVAVWSAGEGHANCGALTQAVWVGPQRGWIEGVLARWRDEGVRGAPVNPAR